MLARDEADIIEEVLRDALKWSEHIWVMDTGSTDGTWEIVTELAGQFGNLTAYRRAPLFYQEGLRAEMFNRFRSRFRPGDWICKMDADEFYPIDPREFIQNHVRWFEGALFLQWYFFRLTQREANDWEQGRESFADRSKSIQDRRLHYQLCEHHEFRMFRYRPDMQWGPDRILPWNVGYPAKKLIPVLHYPHRDPVQLATRTELRHLMRTATNDGTLTTGGAIHWEIADWRIELIDHNLAAEQKPGAEHPSSSTSPVARVGVDTMDGMRSPLIRRTPATNFQPVTSTRHLPRGRRKLALRCLHPFLERIVDRLRPRYPAEHEFPLIPEDHQKILEQATRRGQPPAATV